MVFFQTPNFISPLGERTLSLDIESSNLSKKRRLEDKGDHEDHNLRKGSKLSKVKKTTNFFRDINLEFEKPLPSEWQRCLNIQSGEIHFYNTRTHKKTSKDPRQLCEPERLSHHPNHLSLDLELNLGYDSSFETHVHETPKNNLNLSLYENYDQKTRKLGENLNQKAKNCGGSTGCSSWLSFEADHREMVAVVCMQCHMLVMLCKSSPKCPNCRFMHPLEPKFPGSPSLTKSRFRFLRCKD